MKYLVNIEEVLSRDVVIEAENENDAEDKVEQLYHECKIVLDYNDFIGEPTIKCKRVSADS
ncbi:MAG: DpnD/PcfM family protein [Bacteroidales bacterium]|nr:DpnD/PcfM family protein [Bacteroidales bacterium]